MKRLIGFVLVALSAASGFAAVSVYDDAIWWFNGPVDKNGDGLLQKGEVVDILHGGSYGYAAHDAKTNRVSYIVSETVTTPAFSRTLPCLKFQDSTGNTGAYVELNNQLNAVHQETSAAFSGVIRFKWDGTAHSAAWLLNLGYKKDKRYLLFGVDTYGIRIFPGMSSGTNSLPVTKNIWYDLGYVITNLNTTTCSVRFVLRKSDGTTYRFGKNSTKIGVPIANSSWYMATESGSTSSKYFTGLIQQVAFWDRGLSDAELIAAFDYQPPMPDEAGLDNASGAEFGGTTTAAATFGTTAWKDYPASLAKGASASFTFTADAAAQAYALRVRSASGAATLKATAGGAEATAEIAAGGTADLILPRTAFTAGAANTITLTRTDDGGTFTPDSFKLIRGAKFVDAPIVFSDDAVISTAVTIPQDHVQPIEVAAGKTVVSTGVISGEGAIQKTGLGTLKVAANNTFGGGVIVSAGRLVNDSTSLTAPFGTGTVTVEQNGTDICQAVVAGTLANAFVFTGASNETYPGLHFAAQTTLNGTVNAAEDLWMTTAWNDTADMGDVTRVNLAGKVTVGGTLALAPHCRVNFGQPIACDTLDLRWAPNSATADGGNPGAVMLASCGDKTSGIACPMRRVQIDQTRIIQGGQNIFGGRDSAPFGMAELAWTGLHQTGGSIDMNGRKMGLGKITTPATTPDDETSMTISGSGGMFLNFYETPTSTLYLRLRGDIYVHLATANSTLTFANRHHSITSFRPAASRGVLSGGTRFDAPVNFYIASSGSSLTFADMTDPEALRRATSFDMYSYGSVTFDATSFASLPQDYSLTLTSMSSSDPTYTLPSADSVLKVKRFLDRNHERGPGKYQESDRTTRLQSHILPSGAQIWVSVADATAASGSLTWDAEQDVWKDGDGATVTDTFLARYATVTCAFSGASTATLSDSLFAQDLDLTTADGGVKTLAGPAGSRVQVKGALSLSGGTDYVFQPRVEVAQAQTFSRSAARTLAFDGGLSLTSSGTNVIASGTVSVSGELDGAVLVKCGATLAVTGSVSSVNTKPVILETTVDAANAPCLLVNGTRLDKPVQLGTEVAMGSFIFDATGEKSVTNVFVQKVTDLGSTTLYCREGYAYEFRSAEWAGKHEFQNIGRSAAEETTVILREGVTQLYRPNDGYLNVRDSVRLVLDCNGLSCRKIAAVEADSVLDFRRDNVLASGYLTTANAAKFDAGGGTLELNATHQRCAVLEGTATGVVQGEAGSAIEIRLGNDTTFKGSFEGAASLVMNGTGRQILTGASTSTGSLIVRQGTLEIGATASWANAGQVVLEGGTLSVLNRSAFGFGTTELILAGGQVSGRVKFGSGKVKFADGTVLPDGVYGPGSGWVAEGGSVTVGTMGLMLIIR